MKTYAAPLIGLLSLFTAIFAWIINIQSEVAFIKATQETVIREQGRHEGMLQTYQERGNKISVIELEIAHLKQAIEEHRKSSEGKK